MMVGYTHNSKTLNRIWDPKLPQAKAESETIFDEESFRHTLCEHRGIQIEMFGLPEDEEDVEETDTGDEPLRG